MRIFRILGPHWRRLGALARDAREFAKNTPPPSQDDRSGAMCAGAGHCHGQSHAIDAIATRTPSPRHAIDEE